MKFISLGEYFNNEMKCNVKRDNLNKEDVRENIKRSIMYLQELRIFYLERGLRDDASRMKEKILELEKKLRKIVLLQEVKQ